MKFISISIRNFLSFGDGPDDGSGRINEVALRKRGLVLIEGENRDDASAKSNGAGKTSVVDALLWCLFGITTRGYENDDVVNNRVGKDCVVQVNIKHEGRTFVITRARKDSTLKNTLLVEIDGLDASKGSTKDTQEYLEKLLGFNAQTFLNSVVFGQTPGYRFSRLTDKQQKDVLDDALGIAQYARACELARQQHREVKGQREAQDVRLEEAQTQLDAQEETRIELRDKQRGFRKEIDGERAKLEAARATARARRTDLKDKLTEHAEAASKKADAVDLRKRARTSIDEVASKVADAKATARTLMTKLTELDGRVEREEDKLTALRKGAEDQQCDECGQDVTAATVKDLIGKLKKERKGVNTAWKAADKEEVLWRVTQRESQAAYDRIDAQVDTLTMQASEHAEREREDKQLKSTINNIKAQIEALDGKASPYQALVDKAEARITTLRATVKETKAAVATLAAKEEILAYWVEAFGTKGLRPYLIDTALPFLNDRVAEYAGVLTDGNIDITFRTVGKLKTGKDVERFEVGVVNTHGAHSYKGNSAGESGKIDLCVGLAMQALVTSRSAANVNVSFFDEPFEHIDEEGVERVIELLNTITKSHESVFVVTHNEALKAYFPDTLKVIKEGGFSRFDDA